MVKNRRGKRDHRRHSGDTAYEKVNWDFPCPHRRFNNWLPVVTGLTWDWATCDIDTAPGHDAILPGLLPQLFESFFFRHLAWGTHACSVLGAASRGDGLGLG